MGRPTQRAEAELARVSAPAQSARGPTHPEGEELPAEAALSSPAHFIRFMREAYARDILPTLPEDVGGGLSQPTLRSIERWKHTFK